MGEDRVISTGPLWVAAPTLLLKTSSLLNGQWLVLHAFGMRAMLMGTTRTLVVFWECFSLQLTMQAQVSFLKAASQVELKSICNFSSQAHLSLLFFFSSLLFLQLQENWANCFKFDKMCSTVWFSLIAQRIWKFVSGPCKKSSLCFSSAAPPPV